MIYELRPRLGLRPWLAFFLRARIVAFFVRFDIRLATLPVDRWPPPVDKTASVNGYVRIADVSVHRTGWDRAQDNRSSADRVLTIRSGSISIRAALSQP